jgi:hypothetical protein
MSDGSDDGSFPVDDARLLADLGAALGADDLPDGLLERADGLLAWKGVDHELAALLDDAAAEPAGVRGTASGAAAGVTTFATPTGDLVLEVVLTGSRLTGQVLVGAPTSVVLERHDGSAEAAVDDVGQFVFAAVEPGVARLRVAPGTGDPIVTDWFLL